MSEEQWIELEDAEPVASTSWIHRDPIDLKQFKPRYVLNLFLNQSDPSENGLYASCNTKGATNPKVVIEFDDPFAKYVRKGVSRIDDVVVPISSLPEIGLQNEAQYEPEMLKVDVNEVPQQVENEVEHEVKEPAEEKKELDLVAYLNDIQKRKILLNRIQNRFTVGHGNHFHCRYMVEVILDCCINEWDMNMPDVIPLAKFFVAHYFITDAWDIYGCEMVCMLFRRKKRCWEFWKTSGA